MSLKPKVSLTSERIGSERRDNHLVCAVQTIGGALFEYRAKNLPRPPEQLIRILGLPYKATLRIEEALTHRSASHERGRKTPIPNYERLEFLGDRVIGLIVSEYLLNTWPSASEGDIGQIFSGIVSTQTLAGIARRMDLGAYMILGKGSHSSGDRENSSLLADTFESLAAAIYLEYGLETTRQVLIPWFTQPLFEMVEKIESLRETREVPQPVSNDHGSEAPRPALSRTGSLNYKLLLQKWCQSKAGELPSYQVLEEIGPAHQRRFRLGVFVKGKLLGESEGTTKRGASVHAAKNAWEKIQTGWNPLEGERTEIPLAVQAPVDTPEQSREECLPGPPEKSEMVDQEVFEVDQRLNNKSDMEQDNQEKSLKQDETSSETYVIEERMILSGGIPLEDIEKMNGG